METTDRAADIEAISSFALSPKDFYLSHEKGLDALEKLSSLWSKKGPRAALLYHLAPVYPIMAALVDADIEDVRELPHLNSESRRIIQIGERLIRRVVIILVLSWSLLFISLGIAFISSASSRMAALGPAIIVLVVSSITLTFAFAPILIRSIYQRRAGGIGAVSLGGRKLNREPGSWVREVPHISAPEPLKLITFAKGSERMCPQCNGKPIGRKSRCGTCGGSGNWMGESCYSCGGDGVLYSTCAICDGAGRLNLYHLAEKYREEAYRINPRISKVSQHMNQQMFDEFNRRIDDLNKKIEIWNSKLPSEPAHS